MRRHRRSSSPGLEGAHLDWTSIRERDYPRPVTSRCRSFARILAFPLLLAASFTPGIAHAERMTPDSTVHRTPLMSFSRNWAGYAAFKIGTEFTAVRGHWVQPAVSCGQQPA